MLDRECSYFSKTKRVKNHKYFKSSEKKYAKDNWKNPYTKELRNIKNVLF